MIKREESKGFIIYEEKVDYENAVYAITYRPNYLTLAVYPPIQELILTREYPTVEYEYHMTYYDPFVWMSISKTSKSPFGFVIIATLQVRFDDELPWFIDAGKIEERIKMKGVKQTIDDILETLAKYLVHPETQLSPR
jgi:hypothetical protein